MFAQTPEAVVSTRIAIDPAEMAACLSAAQQSGVECFFYPTDTPDQQALAVTAHAQTGSDIVKATDGDERSPVAVADTYASAARLAIEGGGTVVSLKVPKDGENPAGSLANFHAALDRTRAEVDLEVTGIVATLRRRYPGASSIRLARIAQGRTWRRYSQTPAA